MTAENTPIPKPEEKQDGESATPMTDVAKKLGGVEVEIPLVPTKLPKTETIVTVPVFDTPPPPKPIKK